MIIAYVLTLVLFVILDFIWLMYIGRSLYVQEMGALLRTDINLIAAVGFYLIYSAGILLFAVFPSGQAIHWQTAFGLGAAFGLVAYGTYDLTALAVIKDFPMRLALIDMAWGTVLTGAVAAMISAVAPLIRS